MGLQTGSRPSRVLLLHSLWRSLSGPPLRWPALRCAARKNAQDRKTTRTTHLAAGHHHHTLSDPWNTSRGGVDCEWHERSLNVGTGRDQITSIVCM
ncbi:hypothetical protein B0T19DRAFT_408447 [Cercophora scortea]|uniref:Uncharacterized protein n=1 Tax=Cercophora scortea TaxID=314031 RepID=A0AAE0J380_9PEZI|nr:hypothetical protein B0T19DRAFT_408447 [Cercophora scortea]